MKWWNDGAINIFMKKWNKYVHERTFFMWNDGVVVELLQLLSLLIFPLLNIKGAVVSGWMLKLQNNSTLLYDIQLFMSSNKIDWFFYKEILYKTHNRAICGFSYANVSGWEKHSSERIQGWHFLLKSPGRFSSQHYLRLLIKPMTFFAIASN